MTPAERRVIKAALAWYRKAVRLGATGLYMSDIGREEFKACAALVKAQKKADDQFAKSAKHMKSSPNFTQMFAEAQKKGAKRVHKR